jgi:hypothetical protein
LEEVAREIPFFAAAADGVGLLGVELKSVASVEPVAVEAK